MPATRRPARFVPVLPALLLLLGCNGELPTPAEQRTGHGPAATPAAATADPTLAGIESAFADRNARARWEGNVLHVRMDTAGDDTVEPGWKECRVLSHLLEQGQGAVLELPGGPLECSQVAGG